MTARRPIPALALLFLTTGCLGAPPDEPPEPPASRGGALDLETKYVESANGTRMRMEPARLEAQVGDLVRLRVVNPATNRHAHDLRIDGIQGLLSPIPPGGERVLEFRVPREGRFMYWCGQDEGRHHALGMMGFLYASSPDGGPSA